MITSPAAFAIERRVNDGQNTRWSNYEYDEAGHLLRDIWHDPDGRVSNTITYTYDDSESSAQAYTVNDRFWTRSEYIYDEQPSHPHKGLRRRAPRGQ